MKRKRVRPENLFRTEYRDKCDRHVVTFELNISEDEKRKLFNLNNRVRMAGNSVAGPARRRIEQMKRTKQYRQLQKDYGWHTEHMKGLDEESSEWKKLDKERKAITSKMSAMQKEYRLTWNDIRKDMADAGKKYDIPSVFALTRGEDIWKGIQKVLFEDGKNIHLRQCGDLPIMRAKQAERIIILKTDKAGELEIGMDGFDPMHVFLPPKDRFLQDEYAMLVDFLQHPELEDISVRKMETSEVVEPVFRPCFGAIKCEKIRGRLRCYVQITVAAPAIPKKDRFGNPGHVFGTGRIANDIGPQSVAAVSHNSVTLTNLGERTPGSADCFLKRKKFLLCRMDRSRRGTNPGRFNKDGTYKKGSHGKWVKSKSYRRLKYEYHELCRQEAASRMYANRELANHMRSLGDVMITEPSNIRALAKRSTKKAERSDKESTITNKDGTTKTIHKYKEKKRFGASVGRRSPGQYQAELKKKFGAGYHEVPGWTYRASQYDFERDEYIRKKLAERWHHLPDGRDVQRDIMSAFNMYCAKNDFQSIDRDLCIKEFDHFWELHQKCIEDIVNRHLHICNSGITV